MPKPALTYLTRRGNVYWFRMAVPSDLVERLGRREVKASLGTSSLAAARQRCQHLGSAVLQFIARIRSMPELSQETIKRLARDISSSNYVRRKILRTGFPRTLT